ncbi:MAG: ABC transporter substrate-binding protein [Lachnospiraceae bacterium]|nr:ABC transporter substrate-binding protein [Lachnospiraceae bacterium]
MKKVIALILALALCLGAVACSSENKEDNNNNTVTKTEDGNTQTTPDTSTTEPETLDPDGTHIVTDHAGNSVEVPNVINRIVVADIYPMASVLTVFFDSAEKIVGMAAPCMSAAKNGLLGELYPEILNAKTDFIDGTNVNIEELLKLNPDVVFYSAGSKEEGEAYKNAGIPAIAISPGKWGYDAIETLNQWIETLVQLFPENNKAKVVRDYSEKTYKMVQERVAGLSDADKVKVFFLFQYSDSNIMTSGKKFFGQWWCDAIGAKNAAEELEKDNSVAVNMEQIYAWDPELIFITNFNTAKPDDLYGNTVGSYDWSEIEAIKNKQVYKMPLGMYRSYTCGVDTPVTLLWLAKTVYPSLFEDIDITAETKKYYQEVFGITLTDEQANKIFSPVSAAGTGFVGNGK